MTAPHRQLIAHLALAVDCLDEALALEGYLPHWAQTEVRTMADALAEVLERVGREIPTLKAEDGP